MTFITLFLLLQLPPAPLQIQHFTIDQGLPEGIVYAVSQDRDGFLWVGTHRGLVRYDGYRFREWSLDENQPMSHEGAGVSYLLAEANGDFWVATWGDGLRRRRGLGTPAVFRADPNRSDRFGDNQIQVLLTLENGEMLVGTHRAGLYHYFPDDERFERVALGELPLRIWSLCRDAEQRLWVGTGRGLLQITRQLDGRFRLAGTWPAGTGDEAAWDHLELRAVAPAADGRLWLGTRLGLDRFDPRDGSLDRLDASSRPASVRLHPINVLFRDSHDHLWIGTSSGLLVFDRLNDRFRSVVELGLPELRNADIRTLFEDAAENLWVGTRGMGLFRIDLKPRKFSMVGAGTDSIPENVNAVATDGNGVVWIGTSEAGLYRWEERLGRPRVVLPLPNEAEPQPARTTGLPVVAIYPDSDDSLWLGTFGNGIFHYDPAADVLTPLLKGSGDEGESASRHILHLTKSPDGTLWASTADAGVLAIDPNTQNFQHYRHDPHEPNSLAHDQANCIVTESNDRIWICSGYTGLTLLERGAGRFTHYKTERDDPRSLSSNQVICALRDRRGRLWVGTMNGLNLMQGDTFVHYNRPGDELAVMAILEGPDGSLWLSGKRGITRFDTERGSSRRYTAADGLQSLSYHQNAAWTAGDGRMFIGGKNGLNYFHPREVRDNLHPPLVHITSVKTPEHEHSAQALVDGLVLRPSERMLSINFAALDFTAPGYNAYAYRIDGWLNDWTSLGHTNQLNLFALPAGNYTLEIKGANNDGVWSVTPARLDLKVLPPLYKRWWAFVIYLVLATGAVFGVIRARTLMIQRRADELARTVLERTADLEERNRQIMEQKQTIEDLLERKKEWFANVTHEFRTPLTLILGPTRDLLTRVEDPTVRRPLTLVQRNARRLARMVDQLLEISRLGMNLPDEPRLIAARPIVKHLLHAFTSLAQDKQISLIEDGLEDVGLHISADAFEKIVGNLLSNAVKYTPAGGWVRVSLKRRADFAVLRVHDSGMGIAKEDQERVFERFTRLVSSDTSHVPGAGLGLALVKELADTYGGIVALESEAGAGACFAVSLPLASMYPAVVEKNGPRDSAQVDAAVRLEHAVLGDYLEDTVPPAAMVADDDGDQKTLLIIEDNPDMRAYLAQLFTRESGYQCDTADDGDRGLAIARERVPDVIICDVMMPGRDGYAVVDALKNDPNTSHIPIVLLTARGDHESRLRGLRALADDYMVKPFDAVELQTRVENLTALRALMRYKFAGSVQDRGSLAEVARADDLNEVDRAFLGKLDAVLEQQFTDPQLRLADIASALGMSERPLQRKLKALTNYKPSEYLQRFRLAKAGALLAAGHKPSEVAYDVGFSSHSYFSRCFKAHYDVSPSQFTADDLAVVGELG